MTKYYYSWSAQMALGEEDGVPFREWLDDVNHSGHFAMHPDGFPVFLRAPDLITFDALEFVRPNFSAISPEESLFDFRLHNNIPSLRQRLCFC